MLYRHYAIYQPLLLIYSHIGTITRFNLHRTTVKTKKTSSVAYMYNTTRDALPLETRSLPVNCVLLTNFSWGKTRFGITSRKSTNENA